MDWTIIIAILAAKRKALSAKLWSLVQCSDQKAVFWRDEICVVTTRQLCRCLAVVKVITVLSFVSGQYPPEKVCAKKYNDNFIFVYLISMSQILLYFLYSTSVVYFDIGVVLMLSTTYISTCIFCLTFTVSSNAFHCMIPLRKVILKWNVSMCDISFLSIIKSVIKLRNTTSQQIINVHCSVDGGYTIRFIFKMKRWLLCFVVIQTAT